MVSIICWWSCLTVFLFYSIQTLLYFELIVVEKNLLAYSDRLFSLIYHRLSVKCFGLTCEIFASI